MLVSRLLVTIVLLPIGLLIIAYGGIPYTLLVAVFMGLAAWEYAKLFQAGGFQPAGVLILIGALLFVFGRALNGFDSAALIITSLVLVSMVYHLVAYERGRDQAGTDFGITLAGALYVGWLGAYLISLRGLPLGKWWVLVVLPAVWFADSGAYFIGRSFGRHKLTPRLSPKKTWEGYLGGVITATLGSALIAAVWAVGAGPGTAINPWNGALIGFILGGLTPLGDLGESMIKRQFGVKDSGTILPGHGGAFDRIDSWLWAGAIGFYLVNWFFS